jgi:Putative peptidoglycan binding domain
MKTIIPFLIGGLLLLTQPRAKPDAMAPVTQSNPHPAAAHSGKNAQPRNLPRGGTPHTGQSRSGQNQSQTNPLSYAAASRRTVHEMHNHDWWRQHFRIIAFAIGGFYYWDEGYWYPAWGYDPTYDNYDYDGPIYAYNNLLPDQVVTKVQTILRQDGYYTGAITGSLDNRTRAAIANYQRDNDLAISATVDQPTVESLGLG